MARQGGELEVYRSRPQEVRGAKRWEQGRGADGTETRTLGMREGEKSGGGGGGSPETGQYQGSPLVDTEKADTEDQGKAEMARQRLLREETETAQR